MDTIKYSEALKELLYKMADDQLILGHRNSEWTGIGPTIEEDIAFGSLAQDKTGHAYNIYQLLHVLGEKEPDTIAFLRNEKDLKCCHLVEQPIGGYEFSLVRHFLFDHAEMLRFEMLTECSFKPMADLAKKYKAEIKYHLFHANTWISQLAKASEESKARIQSALNEAYPLALGIFEPGDYEEVLMQEKIFAGEVALQERWHAVIEPLLDNVGLSIPQLSDEKVAYGGRKGFHTDHLAPLLKEMTEVISTEPESQW